MDVLNRYIMFGRGICEKKPVERRKLSQADRREKFSFKTVIFRKYSSQYDISVQNYTEYYLEFYTA